MGRHRLPQTHRKYQVEQMWDIHHEVVRLALIGMKSVDIADHLGITPVMVSYTLRSPIVQEKMNQLQAVRDIDAIDVAKEIAELAPRAVQVMGELMDCELPNVRAKAAADILDRAGHAAIRTIKTENLHAHFSADEIKEIKDRAKDIGLMIEADYVVAPSTMLQQQAAV
jgi:hypothetical protein